MQKQFKREQRYFVVKVKDAKEYLDAHQLEKLAEIADTISEGREKDGIPAVECVVVESDWPEYESTWRAIEDRVTGAQTQPAPSVPEGWEKELFCIQHAMAMNNWNWDSDASNDMKRAAYAAVVKLLAAAPEAKP